MRPQKIFYTWMGEFLTTDFTNPKHDLLGPLALEPLVDENTIIYFCCLKKEEERYRDFLKGKNIVVRSIEDCLEENKENSTVQRAIKLKSLLFSEGRDPIGMIRDRVTCKDMMSLLLLYLEGGYAFDTNVLPMIASEKMTFPHYRTYHMPAMRYPFEKFRDIDSWGMYSPPDDPEHAKNAINYFLDRLFEIEEMRAEKIKAGTFDFEAYKMEVLDVIIDAPSHDRKNLDFWFSRHLGANFPVQLHTENPKVIKYYSNSHGASDRKVIPALHLAVSQGHIEKVKELLNDPELRKKINDTFETDKYKNITALNVACFYGQTEITELLLKQGADANIQLKPLWLAYPGITTFQATNATQESIEQQTIQQDLMHVLN